jgi:hypothetical protein
MRKPYASRQPLHDTQEIKQASAENASASIAQVLCTVAIGCILTGVVILLQCCVLDYVSVRVLHYPEHLGSFDWTFLGSPILTLSILLLFRWASPTIWTLKRIFAMTVLGWALSVVLIVTFGIGYHFWIGGTL